MVFKSSGNRPLLLDKALACVPKAGGHDRSSVSLVNTSRYWADHWTYYVVTPIVGASATDATSTEASAVARAAAASIKGTPTAAVAAAAVSAVVKGRIVSVSSINDWYGL